MARSDEAENFFAAVYQAVQEIPHGKVTSYGHIARLIGRRMFCQIYIYIYWRLIILSSWSSLVFWLTYLPPPPPTAECPRYEYTQHTITIQIQTSLRPSINNNIDESRQVGICLKHLPDDTSRRFNSGTVPWQRVINSKGIISPRWVGVELSWVAFVTEG